VVVGIDYRVLVVVVEAFENLVFEVILVDNL